jgi:hypothetical protein
MVLLPGLAVPAIKAVAATAATIRYQPHDLHQTVEKAAGHGSAYVDRGCKTICVNVLHIK